MSSQEEEFQWAVSSLLLPNLIAWVPQGKPERQLQHLSLSMECAQPPSAVFCSKLEPNSSTLVSHGPGEILIMSGKNTKLRVKLSILILMTRRWAYTIQTKWRG